MLYCFRCLILQILNQVNCCVTGFQELCGNVLDPFRDGCREHEALKFLEACTLDSVHNLFNVLFETKVEHLVSLIEDSIPESSEIEVTSLHMINHTTAGTDENVNTSSELVGLLFNIRATVYCKNIILTVVVLEGVEFFRDLEGELSSWCQNHGHWFALAKSTFFPETCDHRQTEAEGLS